MARTKKIINETMVVREEKSLSFVEWVFEKYEEAFIENMPLESVKELPKTYMLWVGYFTYFVWTGSLLYFFYSGYIASTSQDYMSVDSSSGSCKYIPKEISGTYLADNKGLWDSHVNFRSSRASYEFTVKSLAVTNREYSAMMDDIERAIMEVGQGALQRDLYMNLLYWTTWEYRAPDSASNFYFKADISSVFNKEHHQAAVASALGSCPVPALTTYDISSATFTIAYDYAAYMASSCDAILGPGTMGHSQAFGGAFSISVDMHSYMIAAAINNGVLSASVLEIIESTYTKIYYDDGSLQAESAMYFHPRYPNHTPVFCGTFYTTFRPDGAFMCALEYGTRYAVPIFNHAGTFPDATTPSMCDCAHMTADSYCQYHYGLFGLMLFNEGNGYSEMGLLLSQYDSPFELNRLSYEISFASVIPNANQSAPSSYDFCVVNGHNCSIVMIWMADTKKQVSDMYLTLVEAACVDTFTTEHWSKLENTPPATLQENYFTCTQFWYNAAFDSLGIASGNTSTLVPLVMALLLPVVFLYLQHSSNPPAQKEYDEEELRAASSALALMVLRIRDGKTRDTVADGVLRRLTSELVMSAKAEGGYPDSDDDDEDEGGGGSTGNAASNDVDLNAKKQKTSVFIKRTSRRTSETAQRSGVEGTSGGVVKSSLHNQSSSGGDDRL